MSTPIPSREMTWGTRANYAAVWALFVDWCTVTGEQHLPADPRTVVGFLIGCPAAPGTQRRRVAAIDHHHTAAGHPRPGDSGVVRTAVGRPINQPRRVSSEQLVAVEAALRMLPSHGWTAACSDGGTGACS